MKNTKTNAKMRGVLAIIALAAVIGFSIAGCKNEVESGGNKALLIGTWVKDGGAGEGIDYNGEGEGEWGLIYFRNSWGSAQYYGKLVSYDGTTVKVGDSHDAYTPITFTATIADGKLTVSGLSTLITYDNGNTADLSVFNGTYTKQPE